MAAVDLSQRAEELERLRNAAKAAQENGEAEAPLIEADFAFLVYRQPDGRIVLTHDINVPLVGLKEETENGPVFGDIRQPSHDEVYAAFQILLKDMIVQQQALYTAQATMQLQQQMVQQAMGAQENQELLRRLQQEKGGLKTT